MIRQDNRATDQLRPTEIQTKFTKHAAGSVLITVGETKVICTASLQDKVPGFLRGKGEGWLTAEYSLLPSATHERVDRERYKVGGRTMEIQRLIGRSLRMAVDFAKLGERTIAIDCDVIQADGGTRTASITGAYIALELAIKSLISSGTLTENPLVDSIAAVSVGVVNGTPCLDLCYVEDSAAEVDMNVVMTGSGKLIEVQGTAEHKPFDRKQLNALLDLGEKGIKELSEKQKSAM
jgi:ribonuclease PH